MNVELAGAKKLVEAVLERKVEDAEFDTPLTDIGVDSLRLLEIVDALEKKYEVVIPDEAVGQVNTLVDLAGLLQSDRGKTDRE